MLDPSTSDTATTCSLLFTIDKFLPGIVTEEGVSKVDLRYLFSPQGTNSIAGGTAPGWQPPCDQPCKGCITPVRCNPCRVGPRFDLYRGRCPRLLNLSPAGTISDEELIFDTLAEEALELRRFLPQQQPVIE